VGLPKIEERRTAEEEHRKVEVIEEEPKGKFFPRDHEEKAAE
jgi:hypothetical protein